MDSKSFLSISQLSRELDSGEAIIKFITKRFEKSISYIEDTGQKYYSPKSLSTIIVLIENINQGVLPSAIDDMLKNESSHLEISDKNDTIKIESSLQERNVRALEKNTEAFTKIALALDKNIEIEQLKVEAINNIAKAITSDNSITLPNIQTKNIENVELDDLSSLIDTVDNSIEIDNLSLLFESNTSNKATIDDLSQLITDNKTESSEELQIDNLAKLLDDKQNSNIEIDDLSALIPKKEISESKIDDLSILINESKADNETVDDLSTLINESNADNEAVDDLSTLIDFKPKKINIKKPEFSPVDDFEKYKSEIINIIIDLKDQGLTVEETCKLFIDESILTFSGKTKWSVKTISQIYQLIENAA